MIKVAGAVVAFVLIASGMAAARSPEGCQALNPGQPKCSYTVTHATDSPVSGIAGEGSWVVKIKRGKKTITYKSPPGGAPTGLEVRFKPKDKVTAAALSPGSGVTVGHAD